MDELYMKLYNSSTVKIMVLGGTCSDTTEKTTQASRKHNLVQISYSVLSPRLSNRDMFPWFFRVMAPETELSKARVAMIRKFNWTTITMIQASSHLFTATGEKMRTILNMYNMTINATFPFDSNPERTIDELKRNDARIVFFNSYEDQARNACCVAYKKGFYGKKIVWIFPGFYDLKWYDQDDTGCTVKQLLKVINGYFTVSNVNMALDDGKTVGATKEQFVQRFKCKAVQPFLRHPPKEEEQGEEEEEGQFHKHLRMQVMGKTREQMLESYQQLMVPGEIRAPLAYDAMWTIALTLNNTLTQLMVEQDYGLDALKEFSYHNERMGGMIKGHMQNTSFRGLSGKVNFTPTGDRIPHIEIKQFQVLDLEADSPTVELRMIGLYTTPQNITWNTSAIIWAAGKVPYSSQPSEHVLKPLSWELYLAMCMLACLGVSGCIAFLVFNIKNRNARLIKMSSPKINNLILVGCMLVYCTVTVDDIYCQGLHVLCHVRLYLLVMGFSLGFGALFAKTWRVYSIMTAAASTRRLSTNALRDSRLYMIIFGLVTVNLVVLVMWTSVDAMALAPVNIENAEFEREDDVLEVPQSLVCQSVYKMHFTSGLMALQALLILFGAFLAVQTRKVTIPELNDSRWVGLCIYNVVVLGSLGAILVLGTRQSPDVTYLLESIIVLLGTTLTQCLVFVPKLLAFRKRDRPGSQRMVTVKTMCMSPPSSVYSKDFSKTDHDDPPSPSRTKSKKSKSKSNNNNNNNNPNDKDNNDNDDSKLSSSPKKALRKVSKVLKKCCSTDKEPGGGGGGGGGGDGCGGGGGGGGGDDGWVGKQNKAYVGDGNNDNDNVKPDTVSRAVSTCDLLDLSRLLQVAESGFVAQSDADERARAARICLSRCHGDADCVGWVRAHLLSLHLAGALCSSSFSSSSSSAGGQGLKVGQKGDPPVPCDPHHACCSLVEQLGVRGRRPLRRCLSISNLDSIVSQLSAAEDQSFFYAQRCGVPNYHQLLFPGGCVHGESGSPGALQKMEMKADDFPSPPPPYCLDEPAHHSVAAQTLTPTSSASSARRPSVSGLLLSPDGPAPEGVKRLLSGLDGSPTRVATTTTPGGRGEADAAPPCCQIFHTDVDRSLTAVSCPALLRSDSASQLCALWSAPADHRCQ